MYTYRPPTWLCGARDRPRRIAEVAGGILSIITIRPRLSVFTVDCHPLLYYVMLYHTILK